MNYKDIIGYNKSKKITKKESKPKVNKVLENIKEEFGYKQNLKEVGNASLHKKMMQNIENGEGYYRGIVENYAAFLKQEGHTKEAKELMSKYVTLTSKFSHWMKTKWVKIIRKMI